MSMEGKRFLLITDDIGRFWSQHFALAEEIMAAGAELHLATSDAENNPSISALGITGHSLPHYDGGFNPLTQIGLCPQIFTIMRLVRPDIVHVFTLRHAFFAGIAARLSDMPRIAFTITGTGSFFTSADPKMKWMRRLSLPLMRFAFGGPARFMIFQSPEDARLFARERIVRKESCGIIRGFGVDLEKFPYIAETVADTPMVLFAARLLKTKGIGEFIHAARILKSKGIAARFVVTGDIVPQNRDSVTRAEMVDWAGEGTIEWFKKPDDLPGLMQESAVLCLPCYDGEGIPDVLLEAAATGRPAVTADMPGCREAVEDGQTGLLVPAKDSWALAEAVEKLIADPAQRRSMGEKARARMEENFTLPVVNGRTLSVYRRLLRA